MFSIVRKIAAMLIIGGGLVMEMEHRIILTARIKGLWSAIVVAFIFFFSFWFSFFLFFSIFTFF